MLASHNSKAPMRRPPTVTSSL
ncbi:hypothetical protein CRUP_001850 [Coryphaenoides rupestris]|nr:hypothetical protein CRUP_001850 [Coryphaenoides rupestris]